MKVSALFHKCKLLKSCHPLERCCGLVLILDTYKQYIMQFHAKNVLLIAIISMSYEAAEKQLSSINKSTIGKVPIKTLSE